MTQHPKDFKLLFYNLTLLFLCSPHSSQHRYHNVTLHWGSFLNNSECDQTTADLVRSLQRVGAKEEEPETAQRFSSFKLKSE